MLGCMKNLKCQNNLDQLEQLYFCDFDNMQALVASLHNNCFGCRCIRRLDFAIKSTHNTMNYHGLQVDSFTAACPIIGVVD